MDCEEHDSLKTIHLDAVKGWTEAGGGNPTRQNDPNVVAAWAKVIEAERVVFDHRKTRGC